MASDRIIAWNNTANYKDWKLSDFVAWHRGLVKQFGNQKDSKGNLLSDKYWVVFWIASEGTFHPKLTLLVSAPSQYSDEIKYLQGYPIIYNISGAKSAVELQTVNPIDVLINAVETTFGGINDILDGFNTTTKILKYAIPVVVGAIVVVFIIYIYKRFAS